MRIQYKDILSICIIRSDSNIIGSYDFRAEYEAIQILKDFYRIYILPTPGESDSVATAIVQSNEKTRSGPSAICIAMVNVTSESDIVEGHIVSSNPVKEVVKKNDTPLLP
jgi:hypothetical protein